MVVGKKRKKWRRRTRGKKKKKKIVGPKIRSCPEKMFSFYLTLLRFKKIQFSLTFQDVR